MSFAWGNTVYIVCGRLANGRYTNTMMTYNAATDTWQAEIATPLAARANGIACTNSHAAYVGLGYNKGSIYEESSYLRDFWRYDPTTNTWTQLADFPSKKTDAAFAFADDEHVWVGYGFNGFGNELWAYSIADNTWEEVPRDGERPERRMSMVAATCQGRYFAGTGFLYHGRNDFWEYVPSSNKWERKASVPGSGRHNAACAATTQAVWVMGGWHYGDSLTTGYHFQDILRYAPKTDSWERCGTIPCGPTENGVACSIGDRVYFGFGESNKYELYPYWYYCED